MTSNGITVGKTEFVFSKNYSGSFFFDTVDVGTDVARKETGEIGNTFGTVDIPKGAVDDKVKFQMYSLGESELKNGTDDNTSVIDPEFAKPPKVKLFFKKTYYRKGFSLIKCIIMQEIMEHSVSMMKQSI